MNTFISHHWGKNQIPGINCIVKSDGIIIILNSYRVCENNRFYAFPLCETTIESLLKYNNDIWSEVQTFTRLMTQEKLTYLGGEGAMGNEGFVACIDHSNNFKWALFCTNSNPFDQIELHGDSIHAYTTSCLEYQINIDNPEIINIINNDGT